MIDLKSRDPLAGHKEAWLLGVGPGLDGARIRADSRGMVLTINEAACVHPCDAVIAWDADPLRRIWKFGRRFQAHPRPTAAIVPNNIWTHAESGGREELGWILPRGRYFERMEVSKRRWIPGTATVAIGLLGERGCQRIHLVGMDAFFAWRREGFRRDERTLEIPEGVRSHLGLSKAVQRVLEAVGPLREGVRESGTGDGYFRISCAMQRVSEEVGVELVEG